jgi:hypothetical protein
VCRFISRVSSGLFLFPVCWVLPRITSSSSTLTVRDGVCAAVASEMRAFYSRASPSSPANPVYHLTAAAARAVPALRVVVLHGAARGRAAAAVTVPTTLVAGAATTLPVISTNKKTDVRTLKPKILCTKSVQSSPAPAAAAAPATTVTAPATVRVTVPVPVVIVTATAPPATTVTAATTTTGLAAVHKNMR